MSNIKVVGRRAIPMADDTGTHTIEDLIANDHQSVAEFGRNTIEEVIQRDVENHNDLTEEMVSLLAEPTTDRQRVYGAGGDTDMQKVDEHGRGRTQKDHKSGEVAFPLYKFVHPVGWTNDYEVNSTPADMAQATQNAEKADVKQIRTEIKSAIFLSSNFTFTDRFRDGVSLDVKRLVNADGDPIPDGPTGESFDGSTHTHYNAENGLTNSGLQTSVSDLLEHGHSEDVKMFINQGDESTVKGLSDFKEYVDARLTLNSNANQPQRRLDVSRPLDNRAIGIFGAAEVWIKPWIPSNYILITDTGTEEKPLVFRNHHQPGMQGLRLAAEIMDYPLNVDEMEHYFGVGVWTRTNGVAHYFGGAAYSGPSF